MEPYKIHSKDAYFDILEKMPEIVYVVEAMRDERGEIVDLRIKYANPATQAHSNVIREKLIGKRFNLVYSPKITQLYIKLINKIPITGEGSKDEVYYPKMDKYFSVSALSFEKDSFMLISTDIGKQKKIEVELREKENFLKSIFQAYPGVIWIYDLLKEENIYIYREIYELIGYTKEEVQEKGKSFWKGICHPNDLQKVNEISEKIKNAKDNEIIEIQYRLQGKNGKWRWFDAKHVILKRTPEGQAWQYLGIVEDITEQKKTEDLLRFSERTFRTLTENSPDIIMRFNHELHIIYVNPVFPRLIGKKREECVGKSLQDLEIPYAFESSSEKLLKEVFENGKSRNFEFDLPVNEGLNYYSARIIPEFEKRYVETAMFVAHDITDIKEAEEEILRLANIVECSDDAIIGKTVDGIIFSWNKAAEEIYGYKADEIIGKPISILMDSKEWEKTSKIMEKIAEGETVKHFESKRIRKDGSEIYVSLTLSPIKNAAGEITGISTIARDITEQKT
ncbi:MAG TPA: PAS domain S-box protein [Methanobacterium sp.]|nr:PAS domain S-box protein [Methanobacterium sp.]